MAQRVEIATVTVPAATLSSAPITAALPWRQGYPERVEIRIPPGPSGLVGVRLLHSGTVIIPRSTNEWLITDNEPVIWPLEGYPSNPAWSVQAYNQDIYEHAFQVRMLMNEIAAAAVPSFVPLDIAPGGEAEDDSPEEGEDLPPELPDLGELS